MDLFDLYIDPGTGGMLFTILFGLFSVVIFAFRTLVMKVKFHSGGKAADKGGKKIPIVIYTDHKRYWNVFEPLLDEFEKRHQEVVYLTGSEDDPFFDKKYKCITGQFIGEGNKGFSKLNLLNASVVVSSTPSLDVFQWKRSRNVDYYIHIPHAPNDITLYRMFGIDHYDAVILSGEYQEKEVRKLEQIRDLPPKDIALCGIPFMDTMMERLRTAESLPPHERTVLLAPSWGESSILSKYGEPFIDALIETGYRIIVRPHPQSFTAEKDLMEKLMTRYSDTTKVVWNRDRDNFDVLRQSDILISDFSGVMFDFSLVFDKPVIYTRSFFDVGPYDAYWLEDELWMYEILPSIGLELNDGNMGDIKQLIDSCIDDPSFGEGREKARSETWVHMCEGAKRAVDFIMEKYNGITIRNAEEAKRDIKPSKHKNKKMSLKGT